MKLSTAVAMGVALLANGAAASDDFLSALFGRNLGTCVDPGCNGNVRPIAAGVGSVPNIKTVSPAAFDNAYFASAQPIPLYESGVDRSGKEVICHARLAQTCPGSCTYSGMPGSFVYVQVKCDVELLTGETSNFYVKTGTSTNLVTPNDTFEFIGTSGFEAKFCLPNNAYTPINIHAQYKRAGETTGRTASTGKPGGSTGGYQICVRPICPATSCSADADCCVTNTGSGVVCLERGCNAGSCVENSANCPCTSDSGCFTGESCSGGECLPDSDPGTDCKEDIDCNGGPIPDNVCGYYKCNAMKCETQLTFRGPSHVCRAAVAGGCDEAETCSGSSAVCPADTFKAIGTVCRAAVAGGCDEAETCSGSSPNCPIDAFKPSGTVCRDAIPGGCDEAEKCSGSSPNCPIDAFKPSGTVCRTKNGMCDIEAEKCSGSSPNCPADALYEFGYSYKCATDQFLCGLTNADVGKTLSGKAYVYNVEQCKVGFGPDPSTGAIEETYSTCKNVSTDPIFQPRTPQGAGSTCPNGHAISNFAYAECIHDAANSSNDKWVCCGKCDVVTLADGITKAFKCTTYDHPECDLELPEYIGGRRVLRGRA